MPRTPWKAWPSLSLALAADARMTSLDFTNDQIWELAFGDSESRGLMLRTNYGLRARSMSIFARFRFPGDTTMQPTPAGHEVLVESCYPNYIKLGLPELGGIHTKFEYWAPSGQVVAGRVSFHNPADGSARLQWQLGAELIPFAGGARIQSGKIGGAEILHGQTSDLFPVLFLTGGATSVDSPFTALALDVDLAPGQTRRFTWVAAARDSTEESLQLARHTAGRDWQAEIARIEMRNKSQVEIETGDPDWDRALHISQQIAYSLLHSPTQHLPHITFVEARRPEHGFYPPGSGTDYHQLWLGQNVLNSWYMLDFALPGEAAIAEGILLNYLTSQMDDGRVDSKPGMAGYRSYAMAMPLLADIAWRIYEINEDRHFLEKVFPQLAAFHLAWFDDHQDRNGDGLPEWSHAVQAAQEDHPVFSPWHDWSQGADITRYRSPLLLALLHLQTRRLLQMAAVVEYEDHIKRFTELLGLLRDALEETWEPRGAAYRNIDADSKQVQRGLRLASGRARGSAPVDKDLPQPARLILRLNEVGEGSSKFRISISGKNAQGKRCTEKLNQLHFRWGEDFGTATSSNLFTRIERLRFEGLTAKTTFTLSSIDSTIHDLTLFAPLYAGVMTKETAEKMIQRKIVNPKQYWRTFGLAAFLPGSKKYTGASHSVSLPWTTMVVRGLLAYGRRDIAAKLVGLIMKGICLAMRKQGEFRHFLNVDNASISGERNHIAGLPPIGLFLETLGVRLYSPWKVGLEDANPFTQPVTVSYRGLRVERDLEETRITFPDGRSVTVDDPAPCIIDGRGSPDEANKKEP